MSNDLRLGDVRVGYISDGTTRSGEQAGTLTLESAKKGAELLVPFLWDRNDENPHFAHTAAWFSFRDENPAPPTLLFFDSRGVATLVDNVVSGAALGAYPLGRVRARLIIFGRPRAFRQEYVVGEFKSTIDGLEEFAGYAPIGFDSERSDGIVRTTVVIESGEEVTWEVGAFEYSIRSNVAWTGRDGKYFHVVDSRPHIQTRSVDGATPLEHLGAQWPIRALLILTHGTRLSWRSHHLRDDEFPQWMADGNAEEATFVEVQLSGTIEQHAAPLPASESLNWPMLQMSQLGADGLRRWVELYTDETFERALQPAVEVLNGASSFLEPQLMMLATSLDRLGHFRSPEKRRRPQWRNIERCLIEAQLDWPEIGPRAGIAQAIANINNELKHPDREEYPGTEELAAVTYLARIIVRAQVFDLLGLPAEARQQFLTGNDGRNAVALFVRAGLTVTENGVFERRKHTAPSDESAGEPRSQPARGASTGDYDS